MADYDDTDKGAAFAPYPTQSLILSGKVNNDGLEDRIVLIKDETKNGTKLVRIYKEIGVLFPNDKAESENAPAYTGTISNYHGERRLAAWRREKDGKAYMTLAVSDKRNGDHTVSSDTSDPLRDDSIPF